MANRSLFAQDQEPEQTTRIADTEGFYHTVTLHELMVRVLFSRDRFSDEDVHALRSLADSMALHRSKILQENRLSHAQGGAKTLLAIKSDTQTSLGDENES